VDLKVEGSSPFAHPTQKALLSQGFFFASTIFVAANYDKLVCLLKLNFERERIVTRFLRGSLHMKPVVSLRPF
jgi:hypothetical protein